MQPPTPTGFAEIVSDDFPVIHFAQMRSTIPTHVYEIHARKDHRGVDLISDALPFGRLWYGEPDAVTNA